MVTIADRKVRVGDQAIPLLSGEVHYWRLDPNTWRPILERVRDMGIQIVASYACWDFHEIAPGVFDFRGESDPRRDLLGFLDLLTEMGFWIIFRPGPYIYAEWKNNGVPDRAAQYHRLHPQFLAQAEVYMEAVTAAVKPYLASNGGRVLLWQADNEIDAWTHIYTEQLGLGRSAGSFQEFLSEHYDEEVDALNRAWRADYASFNDARAITEMIPTDPTFMSRHQDYRAFIHWYVDRVAAWAVKKYRALGVDVPIMLNAYSGVSTQRWADLEALGDLAGPDIYPSREFLNRGGAKEHAHVLEAVRYAASFSKLPYIPEYQAGIWHDWLEDVGTLTPNHYRLLAISALQAGAAGWNWYMLVNRDNWYQSPINEWGRIRPKLFQVFQQMTALYYELDPTTLTRITGTAVTFDPLQRSTERPGQDLLSSLYNADIDYDFYDLGGGVPCHKPLLLYAGGSWLSEAGQRRLVEYVENGGHLVCVGAYPKLDEHLYPLNLLNIPAPTGIVTGLGKLNLSLLGEHAVESAWLMHYDAVSGASISVERLGIRSQPSEELLLQIDLQRGERYTAGFTLERGSGRVTFIGLQPSPDLLAALHQQFGVSIPSQAAGVTTALFRRGDDYYLLASNVGNEDKSAEVALSDMTGAWTVRDLLSGRVRQAVIAPETPLTIFLPRKDSTVLHLKPNRESA
jgi:hypothetical protein